MLNNSIKSLTNFVPLMIADILGESEQKQTVYNTYAVVDFYIKERVDFKTVIHMLETEAEMIMLFHAHDKDNYICGRFCGFSLPQSSFMWRVDVETDKNGMVSVIQFTVYTSQEHMQVELTALMENVRKKDNIILDDEISESELLLYFQ